MPRTPVSIGHAIAVAALLVSASGCTRPGASREALSPQILAANEIAEAANKVGVELGARMGAALMQCVEAADTRSASQSCRANVETTWAPVWKAWDGVRAAHDAWTAVLLHQSGDLAGASARFESAWCTLRAAVPSSVSLPPVGRCS